MTTQYANMTSLNLQWSHHVLTMPCPVMFIPSTSIDSSKTTYDVVNALCCGNAKWCQVYLPRTYL